MTSADDGETRIRSVVSYHDRTKHQLHRYARSLGYLDWANQPDPFRRYDGAARYLLPFSDADPTPPYDDVVDGRVVPAALTVETLAAFLELSLGVSATKQHGDSRWKLRCNPSSGNLHPTEGYLLLGALEGLRDRAGVYHYVSDDHLIELRAELDAPAWEALTAAFPPGVFFLRAGVDLLARGLEIRRTGVPVLPS
jgi:hypothetical protein